MATTVQPGSLEAHTSWRRRLSDAAGWLGDERRIRILELFSFSALLVMAAVTTFVLTSAAPKAEPLSPLAAAMLLVANLLPAAIALMLFGRRVALKRAAGLGEGQGGLLHVRLVVIFSLLAAVPALVLAIFASVLFQSGVQFWFSNSAQGMLENAGALAKGYYEEKLRDVGDETVTMASDIRYTLERTKPNNPAFLNFYYDQLLFRKLSESAIVEVDPSGQQQTIAVVAPDDRGKRQWISGADLTKLKAGEDLVVTAHSDRIVAVQRLFDAPRTYLYASRTVTVPSFMLGEKAQSVLSDYRAMEARSRKLQFQFNAALYIVSLAIVALAVWIALLVADRLVSPVNNLVRAAQKIADGDLSVRVPEAELRAKDEVGFLSLTFNRMTERLQTQTGNLISANRQIEDRKNFIETILGSVSSAILSVDDAGMVQLANPMAERLLAPHGPSIVGRPFADVAPHIEELRREAKSQAVVQIGDGAEPQTLAVKLNAVGNGLVVTFEDITQQLSDQRRAAWSDVARRIAHEIKNPLTPIQLAAERLRRRFGKGEGEEAEIVDQLTGTIVRQVGDLRNIVDEFSSFARMPKPVFREEDIGDIVGHAAFLFEVANPDIDFTVNRAGQPVIFYADRRQIGQAATNILKNAVESIRGRLADAPDGPQGRISVDISSDEQKLLLRFADNGQGLPDARERIFEPYVTTRATGSGLGLAIVSKIVEEHMGELRFEDDLAGGAVLWMTFDLQKLSILANPPITISNETDQE
ncbi:ATP-binding protein [Sphingorhabdus sp.]|jgi:two-component system nitrogen regulation sensor histidine kinase NtrY|uniref:sensor histidine kinase n=1 Tax=Sphingorhabdus sp. TaxID=1902408 RepID=UPI0037C92B3F